MVQGVAAIEAIEAVAFVRILNPGGVLGTLLIVGDSLLSQLESGIMLYNFIIPCNSYLQFAWFHRKNWDTLIAEQSVFLSHASTLL